jgi:16S rRNA (adenine1518-N6/adenine1519-N6)-dimethyltransferase
MGAEMIQTTSPKKLLEKYHLRPHKGLGQNFLSDDTVLAGIADAAGIPENAPVLEIGPGLGSLTRHLAETAGRVIAVELDKDLVPVLRKEFADCPNTEIVQGDILQFSPDEYFSDGDYYVAANIPYYITSAVIRHLLEGKARPKRMALTVQKEVAERICAVPGKLSLLALSVQVYGKADMPMIIPASAFYPEPNVDSAVVRIEIYDTPLISEEQMDDFFVLAKAGFGQKRKTLRNSLSSNLHISGSAAEEMLRKADIDPIRRAETVTINEWKKLLPFIKKQSY